MTFLRLIQGDCLEELKKLPSESVEAVITDPPYNLSFMGKKWDSLPDFQKWCAAWGKECFRVLKTGGFLLSFGGTRTHHRLTCGLEDAGFLVRDELQWVYFTGFPKAQDLAMMIEKKLGGQGVCSGEVNPNSRPNCTKENTLYKSGTVGKKALVKQPTLEAARKWVGWKTPALKPACEPIVVCQKPVKGTIVDNVLEKGVGGFNIDACRIPYAKDNDKPKESELVNFKGNNYNPNAGNKKYRTKLEGRDYSPSDNGRFPANCVLTDACFAEKSKFFLIPKASRKEKEAGVSDYPIDNSDKYNGKFPCSKADRLKNVHPTVKPVRLMEHLIKLVTKEGQTVLDPFMGSGTTGVACKALGREFIGIEKDPEYFKIAQERLAVGKDLNSFIEKEGA